MKLPVDIKDIKDFAYITSRKLLNEQGEKSDEVFMWRRKGEDEFSYKLKRLSHNYPTTTDTPPAYHKNI